MDRDWGMEQYESQSTLEWLMFWKRILNDRQALDIRLELFRGHGKEAEENGSI